MGIIFSSQPNIKQNKLITIIYFMITIYILIRVALQKLNNVPREKLLHIVDYLYEFTNNFVRQTLT